LFLVGLMLALMGAFFTFLMAQSFSGAVDTRKWDQVPALLVESRVDDRRYPGSPPEYVWSVRYSYSVDGEQFIGDKYRWRGLKWTKIKEKAEESAKEYPVGKKVTCYVDPKDASKAVLAHESKAAGYSIWFPMLFAVGGLGIMIGAVKKFFAKPADRELLCGQGEGSLDGKEASGEA